MTATFPPLPDWFVAYGAPPDDWLDTASGIVYLLREGSRHNVKSTFRYYVFAWTPAALQEVAIEIPVYHASFFPLAGGLLVSGLGDRGDCYQQVPLIGGKLLAPHAFPAQIRPVTREEWSARPICFPTLRDDIWRRAHARKVTP